MLKVPNAPTGLTVQLDEEDKNILWLRAFLDGAALSSSADDEETEDKSSVTLMTAHLAKGLELEFKLSWILKVYRYHVCEICVPTRYVFVMHEHNTTFQGPTPQPVWRKWCVIASLMLQGRSNSSFSGTFPSSFKRFHGVRTRKS